jgi:hypothetical protein
MSEQYKRGFNNRYSWAQPATGFEGQPATEFDVITGKTSSARPSSSGYAPRAPEPSSSAYGKGRSQDMPQSRVTPPGASFVPAASSSSCLHVDDDPGSLFMPASNAETGNPQYSYTNADFLGGARTGSPEPWIKDEFPPDFTMADVARYSPEPFGKDNIQPDEASEERLLDQAEQRSRDPLPHRVKRKYTERKPKPVDSAVTESTSTKRQITKPIPSGTVTCDRCTSFYRGGHMNCAGTLDPEIKCVPIRKNSRSSRASLSEATSSAKVGKGKRAMSSKK